MFSYSVEVGVGLLLDSSECLARPCFVDNASSFCSTPGAASITFAVELLLLGIVPYTKILYGNKVASLLLSEPVGGLVVDDLVDGLKVFHSSPLAGEEAGVTGRRDGAVVLFDLLECGIQ